MRKAWAGYRCRPGKMRVIPFGPDNIRVAPETLDAWKALKSVLAVHGYDIRIEDTDSYNCREIKAGGTPSLHSYGIALDINWKTNPYLDHSGSRKPKFSGRSTQTERAEEVRLGRADTDMTRAMVDAALAIRTRDGTRVFGWGGDWRTVKDAMHFQIEATPAQLNSGIDWSTVEGPTQSDTVGTSMSDGDSTFHTGGTTMNLPKVFFDTVRGPLFSGSLTQSAVDNMTLIIGYWFESFPNNPLNQLAYVLATVRAEVGANMQPVREGFAATDAGARQAVAGRAYGRPDGPHGHVYYGRGYVQLTWLSNYQKQSDKLGIDLVGNPDLALDPSVAIKILVNGMMDGDFNGQGHGLAFYVNETKQDFVEARRTVNILDRAQEIAGFANKFLEGLVLAVQSGLQVAPPAPGVVTPMPTPTPTPIPTPVVPTDQPAGQSADLIALLLSRLLAANAANQPAQPSPAQPASPPQTDQNGQLASILTTVLGALAQRQAVAPQPVAGEVAAPVRQPAPAGGEAPPLTPVNAALGQTVGKALNGRKTVISVATILATALLPPLAPFIPALSETLTAVGNHQSEILPVAGVGALWGVLGKIDKWFATRAGP